MTLTNFIFKEENLIHYLIINKITISGSLESGCVPDWVDWELLPVWYWANTSIYTYPHLYW